MRGKSLRPQLNQIRAWVRQGRTDAWIAHQLEVSTEEIAAFKRDHDLVPGAKAPPVPPPLGMESESELAEHRQAADAAEPEEDAGAAGEEAAGATAADEPSAEGAAPAAKRRAPSKRARESSSEAEPGGEEDGDGAEDQPARRRRRRGGRGRGRAKTGPQTYEATFDHGTEGYGIWLDPAVADDPAYEESWAGHGPVTVRIEPDAIVIERAGSGTGEDG